MQQQRQQPRQQREVEEEFDEDDYKQQQQQQQHGATATATPPSLHPRLAIERGDTRVHYEPQLEQFVMDAGQDGTRLVWDDAQGAWFPMFDERLMAEQQSAYSFAEKRHPEGEDGNAAAAADATTAATGTAPPAKKPRRRRDDDNAPETVVRLSESSIYITGLPHDVTAAELATHFQQKCGLIMIDLHTGLPRVKVYTDGEGRVKGDALISFFKKESVELAVMLLDETRLRDGDGGTVMRVEKAKFDASRSKGASGGASAMTTTVDAGGEGGGGSDAATAQVMSMQRRAERKKMEAHVKKLERRLAWTANDEVDPSQLRGKRLEKARRTVILKHMFTPEEMDADPGLLIDLKEDVRGECERKAGEVTTVQIYDRHREGVIAVRFKTTEAALACVQLMHNRFFGGRRVDAALHDGVTKYHQEGEGDDEEEGQKKETEEEERARLERYAAWLESGGGEGTSSATAPAATVDLDASAAYVETDDEGEAAAATAEQNHNIVTNATDSEDERDHPITIADIAGSLYTASGMRVPVRKAVDGDAYFEEDDDEDEEEERVQA